MIKTLLLQEKKQLKYGLSHILAITDGILKY